MTALSLVAIAGVANWRALVVVQYLTSRVNVQRVYCVDEKDERFVDTQKAEVS